MNERTGAKGALLDEYERVIRELQGVIADISPDELTFIVDGNTGNLDCRSIQTILAHVISSGYSYANYIRKFQNAPHIHKDKTPRNSVAEYNLDFSDLVVYNIETFNYFSEEDVYPAEMGRKILTRWDKEYDIEQLLEHAIVHILRHRRQIENFKRKLKQK